MTEYLNISEKNIENEHLCCAIADKKHQTGVLEKKSWLKQRLKEGHVFRKLDARGKVFIEYAPLEMAWVPVQGNNYLFIYCLWVSGSFKGQGHGKALLEYCINDAKKQGKSGVCILSSKKKKPFLSDKKFLAAFGFKTADTLLEEYELLALSFDGTLPNFTNEAKQMSIPDDTLSIYYTMQCPLSMDCIEQVSAYCKINGIPLKLVPITSLEAAKKTPCIFNNWAVFYKGRFKTIHLLNEGFLKKMLLA